MDRRPVQPRSLCTVRDQVIALFVIPYRLVGLLAFQLAAALMSPHGLVICDGCGYPYTPEKRRVFNED